MLRFSLLLTCSLLTSTLIGQHTACAVDPEGTEVLSSSPKKIASLDSEKMASARRKARFVLLTTFIDKYESANKPQTFITKIQEDDYNRDFFQEMGSFKALITSRFIESDLNNHIVNLLKGDMVDPDNCPFLTPTKGLWGDVKEALLKEGITYESLNVKYAE